MDTGAQPMAAGHAILASFVAVGLVAGANLVGLLDREGGGGDASSFDFGTTPVADSSGSSVAAPAGDGASGAVSTEVPSVDSTAPVTAPVDTNQVPTAADPARVYVAGDSDAGNLGPPLQDSLEGTGVVDSTLFYKVSSGLTRPDFFDWPAQLKRDIPSYHPDIVVVTFGGNDAQDMVIEGQNYPVDSDAWRAEYARRVRAVMEYLSADGRTLVWVGIPNAKSGTFRDRLDILQSVTKQVAEEHPAVIYVDTWNIFVGRSGGYADYIIDPRDNQGKLVRADDGFHLNQTGAEILALQVADVVKDELRTRGATI